MKFLGGILQDLGYRGEIGYQTFLYSNETEIRKVFIFLVEKLPKAAADVAEETIGMKEIRNELKIYIIIIIYLFDNKFLYKKYSQNKTCSNNT